MKSLWKRITALCLAVLLTLTLGMAALAAEGNTSVEKSKTAVPLNEQRETTVTLSIGADQSKTSSDVVFVLDKSTSLDVIEEALAMLSELNSRASAHLIKVGVVIFNRNANRVLELTELNEENYGVIEEAMKTKFSSGTNIQAGLAAGRDMLDQDTETAAEAKHLVLVSDGVTYLWGREPMTVYSEINNTGEECIYAGNELSIYSRHHENLDAYFEELTDVASWMKRYQDSFEATAETYGDAYGSGMYTQSAYPGGYPKQYVPADELASCGNANDLAMYEAAKEYEKAVLAGYRLYSYGDTEYLNQFPFGYTFMLGLESLGGTAKGYTAGDANVSGMFDNVESRILYEIQNGVVTDVIGEKFDLVAGSFRLTVGGTELAASADPADPNTLYFGEADAQGQYPYTVVYEPEGEAFTWIIAVPVQKAEPLSLSYGLKLVQVETEPGEYQVPTNEKAELEFVSSNGTEGKEVFEKPVVTYTVEKEKEEGKVPDTPKTGDLSGAVIWIGMMLVCASVFVLAMAAFKKTERR